MWLTVCQSQQKQISWCPDLPVCTPECTPCLGRPSQTACRNGDHWTRRSKSTYVCLCVHIYIYIAGLEKCSTSSRVVHVVTRLLTTSGDWFHKSPAVATSVTDCLFEPFIENCDNRLEQLVEGEASQKLVESCCDLLECLQCSGQTGRVGIVQNTPKPSTAKNHSPIDSDDPCTYDSDLNLAPRDI